MNGLCIPMLKEVRRQFPFLEAVIADGGYQGVRTAVAILNIGRRNVETDHQAKRINRRVTLDTSL